MAKWLPTLEKKIEQYSLDSHPSYRVFMSAEPAASRESHSIPQGILEVSIKITNEPPTGMMANLHKAFDNFNQVVAVLTEWLAVAATDVESCSADLAKAVLHLSVEINPNQIFNKVFTGLSSTLSKFPCLQ